MSLEWIVVAALLVVGLICAYGYYLGESDPIVRHYKPSPSGLFQMGRISMRPMPNPAGEKDADKPRADTPEAAKPRADKS